MATQTAPQPTAPDRPGLILFGHGARDPRWREPFDLIRHLAEGSHQGPVESAFLDLMDPTLPEAARRLKAAGATRAIVVPLFLGTGGHIRKDLPQLLAAAQNDTGLPLTAVPPAGENTHVLQAIAHYCTHAAAHC